jgi:hypothetical protein
MRPRKLNGAALATQAPRDEHLTDVFPVDDVPVNENEIAPPSDEALVGGRVCRVCIECGGDGRGREGCEHAETATLHAPSRAMAEAVARLQRAAAEHRAAARAVRALVTTEVARGRAELEAKPPARPEHPPETDEPAATGSCPRCAEREAEPNAAGSRAPGGRRRQRAAVAQEAFSFAREPEPRAP